MSASRTLTSTVLMATIIGGAGLVYAQKDGAATPVHHWWKAEPAVHQPNAFERAAALANGSPMDLDPRRMELPARSTSDESTAEALALAQRS